MRRNNGASRPAAAQGADVAYAYSLEQPLEMFKAGDTAGGLRELRQFVAANPNDRSARNRIGAAVYDRGRELEAQGQREQALAMYEEAVALRGERRPRLVEADPGPEKVPRQVICRPAAYFALAAGGLPAVPNFSLIFFLSSIARSRSSFAFWLFGSSSRIWSHFRMARSRFCR